LLVAWKWALPGGIAYILLALFYLIMANDMHWTAYLFISGPLFLTGALFILSFFQLKKIQP
jgi:uncharacterized membrane protein YgdD (TMEM256/DUF423 family)